MGTRVVVNAQKRAERRGPTRRAAIREAVGLFAQERVDESLGLAIGLEAIVPSESVPQAPSAAGLGEDAGAIGETVVAQQAADVDPSPPISRSRATEERRARGRVLRRQDFDTGEAGRIIDGHMPPLEACAPRATLSVAIDAMARPTDNAAQAFHVDVEQIAGVWPLVSLHSRDGVTRGYAVQAPPRQGLGARGPRKPQGRTVLPRGRAPAAQAHHRRLHRDAGAARATMRPRGPIREAPRA